MTPTSDSYQRAMSAAQKALTVADDLMAEGRADEAVNFASTIYSVAMQLTMSELLYQGLHGDAARQQDQKKRVTPTPLPDPFAESRPVRTYRAWVDEADPPRPSMDRRGQVFLAIASAICFAWGAWITYELHGWLKTF